MLCDAVQMLYSKQLQSTGWQLEHIERLEKLLWAHAIRAEELYGIGICTENLEYSVHAVQDIRRHSSMDVQDSVQPTCQIETARRSISMNTDTGLHNFYIEKNCGCQMQPFANYRFIVFRKKQVLKSYHFTVL